MTLSYELGRRLSKSMQSVGLKRFFPADRLGKADYIIGLAFLSGCFLLFFQPFDMWNTGWASLNLLFSDPLDFYENAKAIQGQGTNMLSVPYPPSIYAIFALWLYPLKLFGFISDPNSFPIYFTYWLKILTTIAYVVAGLVFYRISREYFPSREISKYVTGVWLTAPLALFSQFIFSQYDIFYVALMLVGFLMFLRKRLHWASLSFGLAITFKYFPALIFLPLLLLYEKRFLRLVFYGLIFLTPTIVIELLYGQSPAFIEGVKNHFAVERVYALALDFGGGWLFVYGFFSAFTILCILAYFIDVVDDAQRRVAAYLFLISSIFPFLFIIWHPQWAMFCTPAIVLTSAIAYKSERFMLLDLVGMFLFVATVSLVFEGLVDNVMFRGDLLGIETGSSYPMARLFNWFGEHSAGVFLSGFWGYLVVHAILKYKSLDAGPQDILINYNHIRRRFYIGLLIFLMPAFYSVYKDQAGDEFFINHGLIAINNMIVGVDYGELLSTRKFEQTFVAQGRAIKQVSLFIGALNRQNTSDLSLVIIDSRGNDLVKIERSTRDFRGNAWRDFVFSPVSVTEKAIYKIRLTSSNSAPGNSVTWWASPFNSYDHGEAVVDGARKESDFLFRAGFIK